jgi:VIT1/CCC1 family predicted Fe2+/Mn2+ transporter
MMRAARIAAPFVFSAILFVLSFLAINDGGYLWLTFLAVGFVIAILGVLLAVRAE